jgi:hypothetical protein
MTADNSFPGLRHLEHARPGDFRTLEAVINGKAKNERETVCETAFHLRKRPINSLITHRAEFLCIFITRRWRFLPGLGARRPEIGVRVGRRIVVRPLGFLARSLFCDTFYSVANLRAVIERYAVSLSSSNSRLCPGNYGNGFPSFTVLQAIDETLDGNSFIFGGMTYHFMLWLLCAAALLPLGGITGADLSNQNKDRKDTHVRTKPELLSRKSRFSCSTDAESAARVQCCHWNVGQPWRLRRMKVGVRMRANQSPQLTTGRYYKLL